MAEEEGLMDEAMTFPIRAVRRRQKRTWRPRRPVLRSPSSSMVGAGDAVRGVCRRRRAVRGMRQLVTSNCMVSVDVRNRDVSRALQRWISGTVGSTNEAR